MLNAPIKRLSLALMKELFTGAYAELRSALSSLKGMLRLLGVEYPKSHDVSAALDKAKKEVDMPGWLEEKIEDLKRISFDLAMKRGPAFYGDERAFIPPENLYSEEDAKDALNMALIALNTAKRLLEYYKK